MNPSDTKQLWWRLFDEAGDTALYREITNTKLPESDWSEYSPAKVDHFIKAVLASFELLRHDGPFSTLETGVFAGGTSAVFLNVLGCEFKDSSIHVGIDPYFTIGQSYLEYVEHYGSDAYLIGLKDLSEIALRRRIPYVPYLMSSETFIRYDLLPDAYSFRLFHLDGDHSANAVLRELSYFTSKVKAPAVFILDDIGEVFPGVAEAIAQFQKSCPGFVELNRFSYDTKGGNIGFGVYHLQL